MDEELQGVGPIYQRNAATEPNGPITLSLSDDDDELIRRAPYIPMTENEDLPLFDPSELFSGMDLDCLPVLSPS